MSNQIDLTDSILIEDEVRPEIGNSQENLLKGAYKSLQSSAE